MAYNTETYDGAVMAALEASTGVTAAAPYGVHWGVAPDGIDTPHIVVMVVSDSDDPFIGASGLLSLLYLIRGVAYTDKRGATAQTAARAAAAAALAACHAVLDKQTLAASGFIEMRRQGGSQRYADGDGFYNAAAYYRLLFQYD